MPLPEPEFITLAYAANILQCHPEQMQFLIFEGHLPAYVQSPPELFQFWGVKHDHLFICRCKPPFKWEVVNEKEGLSFLYIAVPTQSGDEIDFPPPFGAVDIDGVPTTRWWYQEEQLMFKMSEIRNIIEEYPLGLRNDDKALKVDTPKEMNIKPGPVSAVNFFTREKGDVWHIGFEKQEARIKRIDGLLYIAYLLEKPGTAILCGDLYQAASGKTPDKTMSKVVAIGEGLNIGSSKQGISDDKAQHDYWRQWQKLQDEIDNAEDNPEGEMVKKESQKKQDEITPFLKERTFTDKDTTRFQSNVQRRLKGAYKNISKAKMEELAKHLHDHINPDGAYGLIYNGALTWDITL